VQGVREPEKKRRKHRLSRKHRLTRRRDFIKVYDEGRRISGRHLVLHYLKGESSAREPRLGITVTKKCGKAVRRNRWKRLIREAYRLHLPELPTAYFVVTVKKGVEIPPFRVLEKELVRLWERATKDLGRRGSQQ